MAEKTSVLLISVSILIHCMLRQIFGYNSRTLAFTLLPLCLPLHMLWTHSQSAPAPAPAWSSKTSRFVTRGPSSYLYLYCSVCITYALPSFAGQLSKGGKSRINALFRKAFKRGLCHTPLDIDELIITVDKRLFGHISSNTHCLHHLLPPHRNARTASSLRTRGHNFTLPDTDFNLYKNSFINRCLFQLL